MGVLEFLGITGKVAKVATSAVKNAQEITENAVDTKGNTKKLFNKTLEIKRKPFSFNIDEIRGRDDEYSAIKAAFEHNDIVVLYGQGGIGKTTCAYYYAEKEKKETYDCIFEFEFATNIDDTLVANIEFENEKPQDKVKYDKKLKQIREYLETTDKKILFIININNIKSDIISLSTLPLNPNNNIKYLFTIREKDVLSFAKIKAKEIDIDKLGEDDLITIFKDNYSKEIQLKDNEILREIIDDVLQYNTKVVVLAARVTKESHKSLKELLDILKKNKLGIEITEPFKGENGLNETFLQHIVTLFKVNNLSVEEKEFLTYMTIIPYDGVELTKLKEWLSLKNYDIPNALWKKGWVDFLGREGIEKIFMHPIISDSVFDQLIPTSQKCQKLLNRLYEKENDYHYYYQKKYLINILQFIIARIGKEETKEIADIYHLLAKIESNVNFNYETCVKNLHTAKNIYEKVLGEENENTATAYNDIAVVYRK
ncbi:MAG: tetratricopeptide repeat protein, partial [Oscillospiraceae bacterium]|nr:tetratricopeptide repeat protein [Oscillospiraceae bacterium]